MSNENDNVLAEIWKPIPGYETEYAISTLGRIKRLKESTARRRYPAGMIIKPTHQKNGYTIVRLSNGDKVKKAFYIHRLVLQTFIGSCPDKHEVNHINAVRDDNRLDNLEYVTRSENNLHSISLSKQFWISTHVKNFMSENEIREIRSLFSDGRSTKEISYMYNTSMKIVQNIAHRKTYRHVI